MAEIKFKVRQGASPQGKPRVYFSCHKKDFKRYFDDITDKILKTHNCAIYYYNPSENADAETKETDLSQMQLFVLPVTENLLNTKNEALDFDFKYAIKNHIPVLPIMEEHGLAEMFNKKCGNIQFLTTYNDDDETAISFSKKLEVFLNSVLVGDETAEKIRAAFDAYVFLSYRKKDRKYAQELMKLIHKNEFCRDIAIWYDEFLVPGENFNTAISEAMGKSKLFALLVTPNLVNEENYVMTTEYPMAKGKNMPLLPAEAVPTDKNLLKEKFEGIPECTDIHNAPKLSRALSDALKNIAVRSNDASPQHNFFIGLAYLSGIDVEVDHERAVKLITFAAEKKLPEACEKLANMYKIGEGVKRDYKKAIEWQKEYVNVLGENKENNLEKYLRAKRDLYVLYANLEDHKKVIEIASEILLDGKNLKPTKNNKAFLVDVTIRIARSSSILRKYADTERIYKDLIKTLEKLCENDRYYEYRLTVVYNNLAILYKNVDRYGDAEALYLKTIEFREKMNKEKPGEYDEGCATAYANYGSYLEDLKQYDKAEEYHRKALALREKIALDKKNISLSNLAASYNAVARICVATNRYKEAEELRLKSHEIRQNLAKKNSDLYERELATSYAVMGNLYRDTERYKEAEEMTLKSLEINKRKMAENPEIYEENYASNCYRLSGIYLDNERYIEAEKYLLEAIAIREKLCETAPEGQKASVASYYTRLGVVYRKMKRYEESEKSYLKAIEIREELYKENPDVHEKALATLYDNIGVLYSKIKEFKKSEENAFKALGMKEKLYEKNPSANGDSLASGYNNVAVLYSGKKEYEKASEYYKKCIELREKLCSENPEVYEDNLALNYSNLSYVYGQMGETDKAIETVLKAVAIREKRVKENPGAHETELAGCYNRLGVFYKWKGNFEESEKYYIGAINIIEKLMQSENAQIHTDDALLYHSNLAFLYLAHKKYIRALMSFCRSAKRDRHKSYKRGIAIFFEKLAGAFSEKEMNSVAISLLKICVFIYEYFCGGVEDAQSELIKCLKQTGELYEKKKDNRKAGKHYRKALDVRVKMYKQNPKKYIDALADDRVDMALFCDRAAFYGAADSYHKGAISLRKRACEKYGDYREKLASDYNRYGLYLRKTSFSFKAEEAFLNAIRINKELGESRKENLAINYFNIGFVYRDSKKFKKAEVESFEKSLRLYMELANAHPGKYDVDVEEGEREYKKALERQEKMSEC